jgi:hypothetical protein
MASDIGAQVAPKDVGIKGLDVRRTGAAGVTP